MLFYTNSFPCNPLTSKHMSLRGKHFNPGWKLFRVKLTAAILAGNPREATLEMVNKLVFANVKFKSVKKMCEEGVSRNIFMYRFLGSK